MNRDQSPTINVAVTGASGFIGTKLTTYLADRGAAVTAISRRGLPSSQPRVRDVVIDDYGSTAMASSLRDVDVVVHLADRADRRSYNAEMTHDAAELGTALAQMSANAGVRVFVAASSIYAGTDRTLYGKSKRALENALLNPPFPMTTVVLRLPPIYGPGAGGMVSKLTGLVRAKVPMPVAAAHKLRRFIGLPNLLDLFGHIVFSGIADLRSGIYEPADPSPVSIAGLCTTIAHEYGIQAWLFPFPLVDRISVATLTTTIEAELRSERLKQGIGWAPPFTLPDQLANDPT